MALATTRASSGARRVRESHERLVRQGGPQAAASPEAVRAVTPDAAMYGVFQPAYAASLAQRTGAAGGDILNQGALMLGAEREAERYAAALAEAQAGAERMQNTAGYYGFMSDVGDRNLDYTRLGVGGLESVEVDPETGRARIVTDPVRQIVGNTEALNANQAERYGIISAANAANYNAGIRTDPATHEAMTRSPWQNEKTEGFYNFMPGSRTGYNPDDQNDAIGNDIRWFHEGHEIQLAGVAAQIRAATAGQVEMTVDRMPDGTLIPRWQGSPEAIQQYMMQTGGNIATVDAQGNPVTIPLPMPGSGSFGGQPTAIEAWRGAGRPNAGAQGGGAPATQATGGLVETHNNAAGIRMPNSTEFRRFGSVDESIDYQEAQIGRYFNRGNNTVAGVINTYTPPRSRGGDNDDAAVAAYIDRTARQLGVSPNQPLPRSIIPQLASLMRVQETGRRIERSGRASQAQSPQRAAPAVTQPTADVSSAVANVARQSYRGGPSRAALSIRHTMERAGHTVTDNADGSFTVTTASGQTRTYGPDGRPR